MPWGVWMIRSMISRSRGAMPSCSRVKSPEDLSSKRRAMRSPRRVGDGPHPDVHRPVPQGNADAPVLGVIGDVHAGHDFQAAGEGGLVPLGEAQALVEDSVDAIAHHHFVFVGLHVDVRGPLPQGFEDEGCSPGG